MKLPDDCFLAYYLPHEAYYANTLRKAGSLGHEPRINVTAAAHGGGCAWEFAITEHPYGGGTIRVEIFQDAFAAFEQIPEFWEMLLAQHSRGVSAVQQLLDTLGAKDLTDRVDPQGVVDAEIHQPVVAEPSGE